MPRGFALACAAVSVAWYGSAQGAGSFGTYGNAWRGIDAPAVAPGSFNSKGAALADGRLVAATGLGVYVETGVGTGQFTLAATLDSALVGGGTDPAFLSVSPDGSRIALGAGYDFGAGATRPVVVFDTALLAGGGAVIDGSNASAFDVQHYEAAWADNTRLALTAGDFGSPARVDLLDVTGATSVRTIVSGIEGASSGIAFDAFGNLYTGNGFASGAGSATGAIRAFSSAAWDGAGAVDFESGGVLVGEMLSASGLAFDGAGNLFVGGGDFGDGDFGYLGVVAAEAVADALAGLGAFSLVDASSVRMLDPVGSGGAFYDLVYNAATGELVAIDGASWFATIPAPGAGFALVGGLLLVGGRRRAA
ncbi:MAG: hypothetical protein ACF8QF_05985 [Phycisphaerales bacterium]